jgi:hypothetical protein
VKGLPYEPDNILGGCPECGGYDEIANLMRDHILVCHEHKTSWHGGHDILCWRQDSDEQTQKDNRELLKQYRWVEPRYYQSKEAYRAACDSSRIAHVQFQEKKRAIENLDTAIPVLGLKEAIDRIVHSDYFNRSQALEVIEIFAKSAKSNR